MMRTQATKLLFLLVLLGVLWFVAPASQWAQFAPWPQQCEGAEAVELAPWVDLARAHGMAGFQLSYVRAGQAPVHCAAGWSGNRRVALQVTHRMRYASLSKLFTSVMMMQLFAEGVLAPEQRLVAALDLTGPFADPRVADITLAQLLSHTAGFDRARSPDPMFAPDGWCPGRLAALRTVQLDHAPGTHYAYANVGYCLLGAVLERHTGQGLAKLYRQRLFAAPGLAQIAPVPTGGWLADEVVPFFNGEESVEHLLGVDFSRQLASGAWSGTARALLQWLQSAFGDMPPALLTAAQRQQLLAVTPGCDVAQWRHCHGFGLYAYQVGEVPALFWRDGSLPGSTAFAAVRADGAAAVFLGNGRLPEFLPVNDGVGQLLHAWLQ